MPGDVKYIDTNGDGKITAEDQVRRYVSATPQIQYGLMAGVSYKGVELNILFQGQAKAEIPIIFDGEGAYPQFLYDQRWTPNNVNARYPRAYANADVFNSKFSDVWLHDGSFVRLKNIEVAYTIPSTALKLAGLRLFVRGTNLLTFDKIKYLDPEATGYRGFTEGLYTPLKTVAFGLNLKL